jgi:Fur family transcriptional regulator, iron response regulator
MRALAVPLPYSELQHILIATRAFQTVMGRARFHARHSAWALHDNPMTSRAELPLPMNPSRLLRQAGLRPTRQRMALAKLLYGNGDRHVTAEILHEEAVRAGERVSLATVYNTLHQFQGAGLLREIAIGGQRAYFDTNVSNHNHFFIEAEGQLLDIPGSAIRVDGLPEPPEGLVISHIDVVVRLVRK